MFPDDGRRGKVDYDKKLTEELSSLKQRMSETML